MFKFKSALSLPALSVLVTVFAAIIGCELWLHDYGSANAGFERLLDLVKQDVFADGLPSASEGTEPGVQCVTDTFKSEVAY